MRHLSHNVVSRLARTMLVFCLLFPYIDSTVKAEELVKGKPALADAIGGSGVSSGGGSNTIVVRARGTIGGEQIRLRVGNTTIRSWALSKSMQSYSASTNATGSISVEFYNDVGPTDVQVDYIRVNGATRQAEDQPSNTGAWDAYCGRGSFTEWLHCNGAIGFGEVSYNIVVRARGTTGEESIELRVANTVEGSWILSKSMQSYPASTSETGNIIVEFTNDQGSRDVQIDYIQVNESTRQAEDQTFNTGAYNDGCGRGSFTQWLHCNGAIGFGHVLHIEPSRNALVVSKTHPTIFRVPNITPWQCAIDPSCNAIADWPAKRWHRLNCHPLRDANGECDELGDPNNHRPPLIFWGFGGSGFRWNMPPQFPVATDADDYLDADPRPRRSTGYTWSRSDDAPGVPRDHKYVEWADTYEWEWWTGSAGDPNSVVRNYVYGWDGTSYELGGLWLRTDQFPPVPAVNNDIFNGLPYPGIPRRAVSAFSNGWERMGGVSGVDGETTERAFFVQPKAPFYAMVGDPMPGTQQRNAYCDDMFESTHMHPYFTRNERGYHRPAREICRRAPSIREVVQFYTHADGSKGCERMVYAFGYDDLLTGGARRHDHLDVAKWFRNGELLWGEYKSLDTYSVTPNNHIEADALCSWDKFRNIYSYSGIYKLGENEYYFDPGTDAPILPWWEMKEGAKCNSHADCAIHNGNSSYMCDTSMNECQCAGTRNNCP